MRAPSLMPSLRIVAATLTLACPVLAQQLDEFPAVLPNAAEAFAGDYGQAVVKQFTLVLTASAAGHCLAARKIDDEALARQARELLVNAGVKLAERYAHIPSALQLTMRLMREAGDSAALAELRQTLDHPNIRAVRVHWPATVNTNLANDVANAFNAHVRVRSLPVKGVLGWVADGDLEMNLLWEKLSSPPADLEQAAVVQNDAIARLFEPYQKKVQEIINAAAAQIEDDETVFAGLEERLHALCVGVRP